MNEEEDFSGSFRVTCACGQHIMVDYAKVGHKGRCPACKRKMTILNSTVVSGDDESFDGPLINDENADGGSSVSKTISFYCPECQNRVEAPSAKVKKTVECGTCLAEVTVPAESDKPPAEEEAPSIFDSANEPPAEEPEAAAKKASGLKRFLSNKLSL